MVTTTAALSHPGLGFAQVIDSLEERLFGSNNLAMKGSLQPGAQYRFAATKRMIDEEFPQSNTPTGSAVRNLPLFVVLCIPRVTAIPCAQTCSSFLRPCKSSTDRRLNGLSELRGHMRRLMRPLSNAR